MIDFMPLQRFLCPVCQRAWVTVKGAVCEPCYEVAWNARMVILCDGKTCLEEVKEEGDLCPSCEADHEEYLNDRAEHLAYEMAKDDYYMNKIDEARGK